MDRATRSKIEEWESQPVSGGFVGLSELASAEFTGAVATGGAHLFMLNGKVVGVVDGTLSAFESGESTAYEAPDPALPLLFAMQERSGEVQGQYYTDDTPIKEVDQTLSEGGFTGFLELSENVLSGDYYVVYYGGRSLAAAFVGNEERVVTGSEAFDLAADEVGIYEVRSVDLEVEDVPEPPKDATTAAAGTADVDESDGTADPEPADATPDEEDDSTAVPADDDGRGAESERASAEDTEATDEESADAPTEGSTDGDNAPAESATDDEGDAAEPGQADGPIAEAEAEASSAAIEESDTTATSTDTRETVPSDTGPATSAGSSEGEDGPRGEPGGGQPDERFKEEERWRESRTVPALDPEESELPGEPEPTASPDPEPRPTQSSRPAPETTGDAEEVRTLRERVEELEAALESTENERRRQAERVEELVEERNELRSERDALEERIEELETQLEERKVADEAATPPAEPSTSSEPEGGRSVDEGTALDQTDLFVRYDSKGQATLQTAHDGRANRDEVAENLRIEMHSRFDANETSVDGRPFKDYLQDTIEYRFVAWLIEDLLYEIQDTGSERALRLLYDALPNVDRAEFAGTVTATDDEGEERAITFDVVCRDRMGKPLIVANINDSLDPATGDMMAGLIEDATAAGEGHESIGAAFLVTASFFQPDALETASGATGGGFLSRDSKKSFVKLARKGGYHLCLAEARGGDFHVAVPDV